MISVFVFTDKSSTSPISRSVNDQLPLSTRCTAGDATADIAKLVNSCVKGLIHNKNLPCDLIKLQRPTIRANEMRSAMTPLEPRTNIVTPAELGGTTMVSCRLHWTARNNGSKLVSGYL